MQDESDNKKAAATGTLSLMKAELENAKTDGEIKSIIQKYAGETSVPFDVSKYNKNKDAYWKEYSEAATKSATITGANEGLRASIEEYTKALDAENRKIAEDIDYSSHYHYTRNFFKKQKIDKRNEFYDILVILFNVRNFKTLDELTTR